MVVESKVANYLKNERRDLKQNHIAEQIGIKQSRFSAIMNGRAEMKADELMRLCFFLKVSPEMFIGESKKLNRR